MRTNIIMVNAQWNLKKSLACVCTSIQCAWMRWLRFTATLRKRLFMFITCVYVYDGKPMRLGILRMHITLSKCGYIFVSFLLCGHFRFYVNTGVWLCFDRTPWSDRRCGQFLHSFQLDLRACISFDSLNNKYPKLELKYISIRLKVWYTLVDQEIARIQFHFND